MALICNRRLSVKCLKSPLQSQILTQDQFWLRAL